MELQEDMPKDWENKNANQLEGGQPKAENEEPKEESKPVASTENHPDGDAEKTEQEDATNEQPVASAEAETEPWESMEQSSETHEEETDYAYMGKRELVKFIAKLSREDEPKRFEKHLKPLKARFDSIFKAERDEALKRFLEEGNEEVDFFFKGDEQEIKFLDYFEILREKKAKHSAELEHRRNENLKRKEKILVEIRELIDAEESDESIKAVRDLQEEWKKVGSVPGQHGKTLWANYNALLDRFYDARSIYFELKDLDRKKNLEVKIKICEKAEQLDTLEDVQKAVIQLNELHEEFKHVGPIPQARQEDTWQRFKSASDRIYAKRRDFVETMKKNLEENIEKKRALVKELERFTAFDSDKISAWNKKTKSILKLQKRWEAVGGVSKQHAKHINKEFWRGFKQFFAHKSRFFRKLEAERKDSLEIKRKLVKEAESLKGSTEWNKTTEAFKNLQVRWKDAGPVPEKLSKSIYKEFRAACDYFFDQRRQQNNEEGLAHGENYRKKLAICDAIEKIAKSGEIDPKKLNELIDDYHHVGFVPRNVIKKMQGRFQKATKLILNSDKLSKEQIDEFKFNMEMSKIKSGPHAENKLFRKEISLKRKIDTIQNDINTWKTNMEFFTSSEAADQLKQDFQEKIQKADRELETLKKELRRLNR